jgi:hypothetical protein
MLTSRWKLTALIPLLLAASVAWAQPSGEDAKALRSQMKQNLDVITQMLIEISVRDYTQALPRVEKLRVHAEALKGKLGGRPTLFQSYAYALGQRAENLISTLQALEANQRLPPEARRSDLEFLHDIAAADFGEVVTTCVACHGRYRP